MVTVFPSTSYTYFQVSSARLQYLLNLARTIARTHPAAGTKLAAVSKLAAAVSKLAAWALAQARDARPAVG
jgi:hypothetical protein